MSCGKRYQNGLWNNSMNNINRKILEFYLEGLNNKVFEDV